MGGDHGCDEGDEADGENDDNDDDNDDNDCVTYRRLGNPFLVACTPLYKSLCRLVQPSFRRSIGWSVTLLIFLPKSCLNRITALPLSLPAPRDGC